MAIAIESFPFNSINKDRLYQAEQFRMCFQAFFTNGIFIGGTELQATASNNMNIIVKSGRSMINGVCGRITENKTLTLSTAESVLDRVDTIVVRLDNLGRNIVLDVLKGTPSSNPTPKALSRTADNYELALAEVYVRAGVTNTKQSDIKDVRLDKSKCGIVVAAVQGIDTTDFLIQLNSWFEGAKADFSTYADSVKDILAAVDPNGTILNELVDAREGEASVKANLNNNYVKKGDSGLGTTAPVYSSHTKTGMYQKTTSGTKYNVLNIYDGQMATQIGVDKTNNRPVYQSTETPYSMVNILNEKDNLKISYDNKNDSRGCVDCVIELANGMKEIIGWISVSPTSSGAGYGGRYYPIPTEQCNFTRCINLQVTPVLGQCSFQGWYEVRNNQKNIAITYAGSSEPVLQFSFRMLVS